MPQPLSQLTVLTRHHVPGLSTRSPPQQGLWTLNLMWYPMAMTHPPNQDVCSKSLPPAAGATEDGWGEDVDMDVDTGLSVVSTIHFSPEGLNTNLIFL